MRFLFIFVIVIFNGFIYSQTTFKMGHINSDELIAAMPEADTAKVKFEKYVRELQNQLAMLQTELDTKYKDYNNKKNTYSKTILQSKESELQDLNDRIQRFKYVVQEDIEKKRVEMFQPILDKVKKVITEVGKENHFIYIFDAGEGGIWYDSVTSIDITPLVKKKLGIK